MHFNHRYLLFVSL